MSGLATSPGATQAQLDAVNAKADAAVVAANAANAKADAAMAEGLTSADRQQAVGVQVTPNASGQVAFVYPKPYTAGIKPVVTTTAETPAGATYRNDASVEEGTATNTQVTIIVQRIPKTLTVNLLGAVLNIVSPVTTPVWINVLVRAPL